MKVGGIRGSCNTFGPKVIRPRIVCGTPVPVGFIMMAVLSIRLECHSPKDEDEGGGDSDIYSWLSLVADIQRLKSDTQ